MRDINILTEDYIQLESIIGNNEDRVSSDLSSLRFQIDEAVNEYGKSDMGSAAYMKLRYSPIFEELTSVKYRSELSNICKNLYSKKEMPLAEAYRMSYVFMEEDSHGSKNDLMDVAYCFGNLDEANIPETSNEEYSIEYTSAGRNNMIRHIAKLQESIISAYENLKSIDPEKIHSGLYTLANAYILTKGR